MSDERKPHDLSISRTNQKRVRAMKSLRGFADGRLTIRAYLEFADELKAALDEGVPDNATIIVDSSSRHKINFLDMDYTIVTELA